jgi:hypothetical protein
MLYQMVPYFFLCIVSSTIQTDLRQLRILTDELAKVLWETWAQQILPTLNEIGSRGLPMNSRINLCKRSISKTMRKTKRVKQPLSNLIIALNLDRHFLNCHRGVCTVLLSWLANSSYVTIIRMIITVHNPPLGVGMHNRVIDHTNVSHYSKLSADAPAGKREPAKIIRLPHP